MSKTVAPAIDRKSFTCPHCCAHTGQKWYSVLAKPVFRNVPELFSDEQIAMAIALSGASESMESRSLKRLMLRGHAQGGEQAEHFILNLFVNQCDVCGDIALWHRDRLLYPPMRHDVEPSSDLSVEIQEDFNEARTVLDLSPRAAAALLRLCIQKLCVQLGLPGKKINDDIATLVSRGLDPRVQKALDLVRVIGNDAVHPGVIDLKDDRPTAAKLFDLVNFIAHEMITRPRELDDFYDAKVSEAKKKEIAKRDGK